MRTSIIVYATSAGTVADDGQGRNGLFTEHFLNNLRNPSLDVHEVFRKTGADVAGASRRQQIPAVYNQFFGNAYLGERPIVRPPSGFETGAANISTGAMEITTITAGTIEITGAGVAETIDLPAWGMLPVDRVNAGVYQVVMRYGDGQVEERTVEVGRDQAVTVGFSYRPTIAPAPVPASARLNTVGASLGTSFSAPWLIGTLRGTFAPVNNLFLEIGFDFGLVSGVSEVGFYSMYPYLNAAYYRPIAEIGGWYAGLGGGYLIAELGYPEGQVPQRTFAANVIAGVYLFDWLNISYTFKTNFNLASNKLTIGYAYRFRQR